MLIQCFPSGPFETNAYIVACPETKEAAIVDPAPESAPFLISFIEKNSLKPTKILLTHSHWDHIGDAAALKKKYRLPLYLHPADSANMERPGSDGLPCWIAIEGAAPDGFLEEGERIPLGSLEFEVIHTPGHTPGGICLYCEKEGTLISGDTLFQGSIGNLSFCTAEPEKMWESLAKLEKLPPETRVFPGHGPATTIGAESWLPRAKELFSKLN